MSSVKELVAALAGVAVASAVVFAQAPAPVDKTKLKNPAALTGQAPATYNAALNTSKGKIVITVHRDWAPIGADRFYNLVKGGFYDDIRFFRVIPDFMAQFGIHGDPAISAAWTDARLKDDPVKESNKPGFVTFATAGPNTRTTQLFINIGNNSGLDKQGFAPFGEVTSGMDVVGKLYDGYAEIYKRADFQLGRFMSEGNAYLTKQFPKMDYIKTATIEK